MKCVLFLKDIMDNIKYLILCLKSFLMSPTYRIWCDSSKSVSANYSSNIFYLLKLGAHMSLYHSQTIFLKHFYDLPVLNFHSLSNPHPTPSNSHSPWRINFIWSKVNLLFPRIINSMFRFIWLSSFAGEELIKIKENRLTNKSETKI